ncbi:MAG: hypothetical protein RTU92_01865 [Candidatus Thorarchaeota archaeon]
MKLTDRLIQRATGKNMLIFLIISVVTIMIMSLAIVPIMDAESGNLSSLDTRFFYTYDDVTELLTALGPTGRLYYLYQKIVDSFFPIGYGIGLTLALGYLWKRNELKTSWSFIILLPVIGAVFDYTENILITTQLVSFPVISEVIVNLAVIATILKWVFLYAAFALLFILILVVIIKSVRTGKQNNES